MILADTKLEFGRPFDGPHAGRIVLGDEVLTPDSSRFWPADAWEPGHAQPSFDKQFVRDWLTSPASGWDRASDAPPPPLPHDVVARTHERYLRGLPPADRPAPTSADPPAARPRAGSGSGRRSIVREMSGRIRSSAAPTPNNLY